MGKDEFLKLMMAQLAHQDPTSPADSQAFVAQLAQFANVEQLQNVNSQLQTLLVAQNSSNQTEVVNLVGKDVVFKSTTLQFDGNATTTPVHGTLSADAATVNGTVKDKTGKVVATINGANMSKGPIDLTWNGLDTNGNRLPAGEYTVTSRGRRPSPACRPGAPWERASWGRRGRTRSRSVARRPSAARLPVPT